jgi:hypothetical protein
MLQLVLLAILLSIEISLVVSVSVLQVSMSSTIPILPEPVRNATLNALLVLLLLLSVLLVTLTKTEFKVLTQLEDKLAVVNQDSSQLLMVHVFNLTAMLILSVLNVNKASTYVFNA